MSKRISKMLFSKERVELSLVDDVVDAYDNLKKEVETGANGTQDYIIKKGVNKGKKANG